MLEKGNYTLVSRLGWVYALTAGAIALAVTFFTSSLAASPLWGLALVCLFLFRDPDREIPSLPLAIVSPADGTVVSVESIEDPYIKRPAICITIKMSFWGTYVTRSPTEGKVMERWFQAPHSSPGSDPGSDIASYGLWVQTDEQDDIVLVMTRRSAINRPHCYVQSGERIGQGQRCGVIRFGSDIQVYVPSNSKIAVQVGDKIRAGSDVIATLVHK